MVCYYCLMVLISELNVVCTHLVLIFSLLCELWCFDCLVVMSAVMKP
jgi:hypothetical protein